MTNKIIIITGQTATGKTSLALKLAQQHNGELINSDSRQVYKYLDIITGKVFSPQIYPSYADLQPIGLSKQLRGVYTRANSFASGTKIWLYDVVNPKAYFSSFDFVRLAIPIIKKLLKQGKTPIIVGGTYFYLYHLLYDVKTEKISPNWKLRKKLDKKSIEDLQNALKSLNPQTFQGLNQSEKNNPQRLIRKIEIVRHNRKYHLDIDRSKMVSSKIMLKQKLKKSNLTIDFIGLKFKDRQNLRKAIEKRVEERLKSGAIAEVKKLLKIGYKETDPGLKTIGYQQLILHLRGEINLQEAINQWINKEIQYAKRQYTFMKKDTNIRWSKL